MGVGGGGGLTLLSINVWPGFAEWEGFAEVDVVELEEDVLEGDVLEGEEVVQSAVTVVVYTEVKTLCEAVVVETDVEIIVLVTVVLTAVCSAALDTAWVSVVVETLPLAVTVTIDVVGTGLAAAVTVVVVVVVVAAGAEDAPHPVATLMASHTTATASAAVHRPRMTLTFHARLLWSRLSLRYCRMVVWPRELSSMGSMILVVLAYGYELLGSAGGISASEGDGAGIRGSRGSSAVGTIRGAAGTVYGAAD